MDGSNTHTGDDNINHIRRKRSWRDDNDTMDNTAGAQQQQQQEEEELRGLRLRHAMQQQHRAAGSDSHNFPHAMPTTTTSAAAMAADELLQSRRRRRRRQQNVGEDDDNDSTTDDVARMGASGISSFHPPREYLVASGYSHASPFATGATMAGSSSPPYSVPQPSQSQPQQQQANDPFPFEPMPQQRLQQQQHSTAIQQPIPLLSGQQQQQLGPYQQQQLAFLRQQQQQQDAYWTSVAQQRPHPAQGFLPFAPQQQHPQHQFSSAAASSSQRDLLGLAGPSFDMSAMATTTNISNTANSNSLDPCLDPFGMSSTSSLEPLSPYPTAAMDTTTMTNANTTTDPAILLRQAQTRRRIAELEVQQLNLLQQRRQLLLDSTSSTTSTHQHPSSSQQQQHGSSSFVEPYTMGRSSHGSRERSPYGGDQDPLRVYSSARLDPQQQHLLLEQQQIQQQQQMQQQQQHQLLSQHHHHRAAATATPHQRYARLQQQQPPRQHSLPPPPPDTYVASMALPSDANKLTVYQSLLRQSLEYFCATSVDVAARVRGRKQKIRLHQIGIRCRFCAHIALKERSKGAVYYPKSLINVYQAAQNIAAAHFPSTESCCPYIPLAVLQEIEIQKPRRDASKAGRSYWLEACQGMGIFEHEGALWLKRQQGNDVKEEEDEEKGGGALEADGMATTTTTSATNSIVPQGDGGSKSTVV